MQDNKRMISLEISGSLREALRVEAFKRDVTISALIRQILEEKLQSPSKDTTDKVAK
jgi:hypothetical protein